MDWKGQGENTVNKSKQTLEHKLELTLSTVLKSGLNIVIKMHSLHLCMYSS